MKIIACLLVSLALLTSARATKLVRSTPPATGGSPFVIPYLDGDALQLGADVFRVVVSKKSSNGDLTFLGTYGMSNQAVTPHFHRLVIENFFCFKGRVRLWVGDEAREFGPGDFGSVPHGANHSYQFIEPDSALSGVIQPGGFEDFFYNVSTPYSSATGAPFPPDRPIDFPIQKFLAASSDPKYDVTVTNAPVNNNLINGTTGGVWHTGNNTLPATFGQGYFVANNWGPKYYDSHTGTVIATLMTGVQSNNNLTISTLAMRRHAKNETLPQYKFPVSQTMQVLEGQLTVKIAGETKQLIYGDTLYLPPNTTFNLWSDVKWTKVLYTATGNLGLDSELAKRGVSWDYAVFPSYF